MYCARCRMYHFGGSRCPSCGDLMVQGGMKFTRTGEPLAKGTELSVGAGLRSPEDAARKRKEVGKSEGLFLRLIYKAIESAITCVFFHYALRCAMYLGQIMSELMRTGGDIEANISFIEDIRWAVQWWEYGAWGLITILIFIFRRNPR